MKKVLDEKFFDRKTDVVARELLGKFLVRRINGKEVSVIITETEAYDGFFDKASHAYKGRTKRTEVMFGHPANFYVYLCYGMYYMLNVVTRELNYPAAVLIRGAIEGQKVLDGPGKITKFLKINEKFNSKIASKKVNLWFEDRGFRVRKDIKKAARVGVDYAGPFWSKRRLRFTWEGKRLPKVDFY